MSDPTLADVVGGGSDSGIDVLKDKPVLGKSVPPELVEYMKSLSWRGIGIIAGGQTYPDYYSKLMRLDIVPNSRLVFQVPSITVRRLFLLAKEVFIQGPAKAGEESIITYQLLEDLKGANGPDGPPGRSWRVSPGWDADDGGAGGPGQDGSTGGHGKSYDAPEIYFVFQKLTIQNPRPGIATNLNFAFSGLRGGDGGRGGNGGAGGNGAKGTAASDGSFLGAPFCEAGPGRGGDSGRPGSGGKGGNAGKGGNGGQIHIICPQAEGNNVSFSALVDPGKSGGVGAPGSPGAVGQEGGGGTLSSTCRDGRGSGNKQYPNPQNHGPGDPNVQGMRGVYAVTYRDNTDIFTP